MLSQHAPPPPTGQFLGITHLFVETHGLAAVGVLLLFYGLYYGVLTRDCAEFATSRMASVMGLVKKGEVPPFFENTVVCLRRCVVWQPREPWLLCHDDDADDDGFTGGRLDRKRD